MRESVCVRVRVRVRVCILKKKNEIVPSLFLFPDFFFEKMSNIPGVRSHVWGTEFFGPAARRDAFSRVRGRFPPVCVGVGGGVGGGWGVGGGGVLGGLLCLCVWGGLCVCMYVCIDLCAVCVGEYAYVCLYIGRRYTCGHVY